MKRLLSLLILVLAVIMPMKLWAQEPYAVLSEDSTVLTFYYDDQKAARNGMSVGPFSGYVQRGWHSVRSSIAKVVFDDSFAMYSPTSTALWFWGLQTMTEIIGLENLHTDQVTDMNGMFHYCYALETLDLSNFNTAAVTNIAGMFYGCNKLKTITVGEGWTTDNIITTTISGTGGNGGWQVFSQCTSLVGGAGTKFDASHTDYTYAHIDGGPSNPGYLTEKLDYNDGDLFTAETVEGIMLKYRVISEADKTCQVGTMVDTDSWISSDIANAVDDPMVEGTITIPEYAKGYRVIKIGYEAFINCTQVTSIVIPNTVTEITTAAMAQSGLTAITIPSSVSSIHYDFLHNCSNLESIVVEEGNQVYDSRNSCNALIETATNKLMMGCKTSTVPNGIETIGTAAFILCKGLTAIELPNTVTRIETQAFNSSDLSSINLPPSLEYIGYSCFAGSNVTSFVIPANVKEIMLGAFNCNGLTSIVVEQGNQVYDSRDNCNAIIETATNTLFEGFSVTVIPNSVTTIGSSAFREVWDLHEITIPESVAAIGEHAFIHTYLEKVTSERPEPVEIPDNAFSDNCYEQATLYVPQSSIEAYSTTGGWKNFKSILAIVEGGTAEPYAVLSEDSLTVTFYYDDQKTSRGGMDINNSILDNSNSPYGTATSAVFDVSFDAYRPTSTACWFENCSSLATINGIEYLHTDDVTNMSWMFECCFNLEELDLSNFNTSNVTEMYGMFLSCQGLKSLNVSSFNTSKVVGMNQMFCGLSNLTNLDLSNFDTSNVRWMYAMFADCPNLTSLDISSFNSALVSNMGDLFSNCVKLKTIYVGDGWATTGVEENGDHVFDNCPSLVGGKGTTYDANHVDYTYARIDGGPSNPGYFTDKNAQADDGLELYAIDVESEMKSNETFMPTQSVKMTLGNDSEWSTNNDLAPELGGELKFDANIYYPGIYNKNYAFVSSVVGTNNPAAGPLVDGMSTGSSYKPRWRNLPESGAYFIFESEQDGSLIVPIRINPNKPLYVTDDAGVPLIAYQLKDQDGVTVALDANSSTAEKTIAFLSLNVSKNQKYYIFCKGSKPRVGGYIFAPHTIDIDPATTAAALDSLLAEPVDATFDSNGVLSVGGGTTMADALEYVGGRAEVAKTITAIVWNSTASLTNDDLKGLDNPNMLIYVKDAAFAPANRDNVVIGDFAKNIVLTDVESGNNNFYCPQAFTAENVSYIRDFKQSTKIGVSRGWESIALPFNVQTVTHEKQGMITPFGNSASKKHFWLRRLGDSGLAQATAIEANVPYIVSMPNDDVNYTEEFNLSGRVMFTAQEVTIPVTESVTLALADSTIKMVPAFQSIGRASDVWAINVGETRDHYLEGSVFERDYREVRPFEAYTVHTSDGSAPRFVPIQEIGSTTGIEDVRGLMSNGRGDKWYDLNGRRLQQKPTQKGVYMNNGRKVVIH